MSNQQAVHQHMYFLLQRNLENISNLQQNMQTSYFHMLNLFNQQQNHMSSLLNRYLDNNIIHDYSNVNDSETHNNSRYQTRFSVNNDERNTNASRQSTRYSNRQANRNTNRNRNIVGNQIFSRRNSTDDVWNNILNFANQPNLNSELFRPVIVRPTIFQIQQATETLTFSTIMRPLNNTCPITQEAFNDNDRVTRIKHCGHIFHSQQINEWFRRNVHCPVCRFDIRDHSNNIVTSSIFNRRRVNGQFRNVNGSDNDVSGNDNDVSGNDNNVPGNDNDVSGNDNDVFGNNIRNNVRRQNNDIFNQVTDISNVGYSEINPPRDLVELAQNISSELANAFNNSNSQNLGDITIEYGVITPQQINNDSIQNNDNSNNDIYDEID